MGAGSALKTRTHSAPGSSSPARGSRGDPADTAAWPVPVDPGQLPCPHASTWPFASELRRSLGHCIHYRGSVGTGAQIIGPCLVHNEQRFVSVEIRVTLWDGAQKVSKNTGKMPSLDTATLEFKKKWGSI